HQPPAFVTRRPVGKGVLKPGGPRPGREGRGADAAPLQSDAYLAGTWLRQPSRFQLDPSWSRQDRAAGVSLEARGRAGRLLPHLDQGASLASSRSSSSSTAVTPATRALEVATGARVGGIDDSSHSKSSSRPR